MTLADLAETDSDKIGDVVALILQEQEMRVASAGTAVLIAEDKGVEVDRGKLEASVLLWLRKADAALSRAAGG